MKNFLLAIAFSLLSIFSYSQVDMGFKSLNDLYDLIKLDQEELFEKFESHGYEIIGNTSDDYFYFTADGSVSYLYQGEDKYGIIQLGIGANYDKKEYNKVIKICKKNMTLVKSDTTNGEKRYIYAINNNYAWFVIIPEGKETMVFILLYDQD